MKYHYFKWCKKEYVSESINDIVFMTAESETETIYLGCFKDNKIMETPKYKQLDWDVQKGADRLYKIILNKYWCRDFKKKHESVLAQLQNVGKSFNILPWQIN